MPLNNLELKSWQATWHFTLNFLSLFYSLGFTLLCGIETRLIAQCNFCFQYLLFLFSSMSLFWLKFIYSEKATKFWEIFTLLLSVCTVDKIKVKISQIFVAFSEYMNFNCVSFLYILGCMTLVHQKKAAGIH